MRVLLMLAAVVVVHADGGCGPNPAYGPPEQRPATVRVRQRPARDRLPPLGPIAQALDKIAR